MCRLLAIALTLSAAVAHAETPRFALAVNNPLLWSGSWPSGKALAISGYVGVSEHVAIRANVANYPIARWRNLVSLDDYYMGRTMDLGLGIVVYTRHRFAGAFAELGVLRRSSPAYHVDGYEDAEDGWKLAWSGRALVGYSLPLGDTMWIAAATGLSVGHETAAETDADNVDHTMVTHWHVDHVLTDVEWMFRIGASF